MIVKLGRNKIDFLSYENDDEIFINCMTWYWTSSLANSVLKRLLGEGTFATIISAFITMPAFFAFIILSLLVLNKYKKTVKFLIPENLFILLFLFSFLRGTPYKPMITLFVWLTLSLILATVMTSISNYEKLYEAFEKLIPLYTLLAMGAFFLRQEAGDYMMNFSFLLVLPICQCIHLIVEKRRYSYFAPLLVLLILILLKGSRGALGCIVAFILLHIIFKSKRKNTKVLLCVTGIFSYVFFTPLVNCVYAFLEHHNISSRTIWLLVNDIDHDSGRSVLYKQAQKLIAQKPILGWGIAGERMVMDVYPHNIVYEFLIDYGKPVGYLLLVILILRLIDGFKKSTGKYGVLYTIFFASSVALLWSGSYLSTPSFWICIYMAIHVRNRKDFPCQCHMSDEAT